MYFLLYAASGFGLWQSGGFHLVRAARGAGHRFVLADILACCCPGDKSLHPAWQDLQRLSLGQAGTTKEKAAEAGYIADLASAALAAATGSGENLTSGDNLTAAENPPDYGE